MFTFNAIWDFCPFIENQFTENFAACDPSEPSYLIQVFSRDTSTLYDEHF